MIVYVVKRRWFEKQDAADAYRKLHGLKPSATAKVAVGDRAELCALLNALCDPPAAGNADVRAADRAAPVAPGAVIDEAYVDPHLDVPDYVPLFLIADPDQRKLVKADREARGLLA
jgi:hypothetical protein